MSASKVSNNGRSRRQFIHTAMMVSGGLFATSCGASLPPKNQQEDTPDANQDEWFMPDEGEPHLRTWMAFATSEDIWGEDLLAVVRQDLATIARTIARYEPVRMLVTAADHAIARDLVGPTVELVVAPLDDLWIRDTGPVFVLTEHGAKAAVQFNFNGWGEKQDFDQDAKVARFVAAQTKNRLINTRLVLEGGGIEVDGHGSAIITESCVLNRNRNPGVSKIECEIELKRLLGLEKIIWLPGIAGRDITDGHTDFYARFVKPGVVVAGYDPDPWSYDHTVTKKHLEILRNATDAQGRKLEVAVMQGPTTVRELHESDDFAAGYINFYVCNGAVIAPEFGDANADHAAKVTLQTLFPGRDIVQINIDGIAAGGGGIHCTTQQEPEAA